MTASTKGRGLQLSIRVAAMAGFAIPSLLIASVAIGLQFYFSKIQATDSTATIYQNTAQSIRDYIDALESRTINTTRMLADYSNLLDGKVVPESTRMIFADLMRRNPEFNGIHIGFSDGDMYELINLQADANVRHQLQAAPEDRWVAITVSGKGKNRQRQLTYFEEGFKQRHSWRHHSDYDVGKRPWFIKAQPGEVHKTAPYLFQHLQAPGQTYSTRISGSDAVLAVDIGLSSLSEFLNSRDLTENSQLYLFRDSGEIIASNQSLKQARPLPDPPVLQLNAKQQAAADNNRVLLVANETDWPPINFSVAGRPYGYAIDLLHYIAQMTGLQIRYINGLSWPELAAMFGNSEIDVIQPVFFNPSREVFGDLSAAFMEAPFAVLTRPGHAAVRNIAELNGQTVAVPKGWSLTTTLVESFPKTQVLEVATVRDMFVAVREGRADAAIDTAATLKYTARKFFFNDLLIHPSPDFSPAKVATSLHFMINKNRRGLAELFNTAMAALGPEHWDALQQKWLTEAGQASVDIGVVPYRQLLDMAIETETDQLQLRQFDGRRYFVYMHPVNDREHFAILTPIDSVLAPALEKVWHSIGLTAIILLILLPLSWFFASPIVRAVHKLALDSDRIKQRRFSEVEQVSSSITEIGELANSMMEMSESIRQQEQQQQELMEAFIELIAQAIDDKSPYTAGHCARVPELAFMLAEEAEQSDEPPFRQFGFRDEQEWREFRIGAWLHDCGKITTPEHIVDKGTKLETIYNRIHEIRMRFEVLHRDAEIDYWRQREADPEREGELSAELNQRRQQLQEDFTFIADCNVGSESMDQVAATRLHELAQIRWQRHFDDRLGLSPVEEDRFQSGPVALPASEPLLSDRPEHIIPRPYKVEFDPKLGIKMQVPEHLYNLGELHNLTVRAGTLTAEDRFKINEHIISTIRMLENLPFPPELARVPRYASTHHETTIGTGYPRGLTAEDLSIPERIMVLADIFEALTAADRPYKKAKSVSMAVHILHKMVERQHVDRDVFELFLRSGVYLNYARRFLPPEQIDPVDISPYLREAS